MKESAAAMSELTMMAIYEFKDYMILCHSALKSDKAINCTIKMVTLLQKFENAPRLIYVYNIETNQINKFVEEYSHSLHAFLQPASPASW